MPENITGIAGFGAAIAFFAGAFYVLVKEVIVPLVNRNSKPSHDMRDQHWGDLFDRIEKMLDMLASRGRKIDDVHGWLDVDSSGEQGWKGKHLERLLQSIDNHLQLQIKVIESSNANLMDLLKEIRRSNGK